MLRSENNGQVSIVLNQERGNLPSGQTLVIENHGDGSVPQVVDALGQIITVKTRSMKDRLFLTLP
jgi:hypothetical protein